MIGNRSIQNGRVLLVDDVTSTGGTLQNLKQLAETHEGICVGIGLMATKGWSNPDLGCKTVILTALEEMFFFVPNECPLCREGIEISNK